MTVTTSYLVPHHPGLEALADAFCMAGADGRVTYWNAAAERLFAVPRDAVVGRALSESIPGADDAALRAGLASAFAGRTVRFATTLAGRPFSVTAAPADEGGVAVQLREAPDDGRSAERYARLLESIRSGFVAVDASGRVVYVNGAARAILGLGHRDLVGSELWRLLPAEPAALGDALRATLALGEPRHLEAVRPEGRALRGRAFDVWTEPLPGGGISILFEDVTWRLERETELARLAAEAEEASRAKSRFFTAVSHELRTPLHAIVGYTHLLATGTFGELPDGAERAAERAEVCAEHLARLIEDVLLLTTTELSRLPVSPATVHPGPLLREVLEPLRRQAEAKGLAFTLDAPDTLPAPETDPERLRQLLQALVGNAIKFTSRGEVRVEAREAVRRERPVSLRRTGELPPETAALEIAVRDTGPGIPAAERARIFEAFEQMADDPSRTDSVNRGAGLGLTVARQLSRLLGGALELESEPGEGTVFRLWLPMVWGTRVG